MVREELIQARHEQESLIVHLTRMEAAITCVALADYFRQMSQSSQLGPSLTAEHAESAYEKINQVL